MELAARLAEARQRLADLEGERRELEASTAEGPDDEHDPEGATIGFERARVAGLAERARTEVAELQAAAERVRAGTYGTCRGCGRPIGRERLAALPATATCVGCAS